MTFIRAYVLYVFVCMTVNCFLLYIVVKRHQFQCFIGDVQLLFIIYYCQFINIFLFFFIIIFISSIFSMTFIFVELY